MKNKVQRSKRLLKVQSQVLLSERLHLQTLTDVLGMAREDERSAIAFLSKETSPVVPPGFATRRAALCAASITHAESQLTAQAEKTVAEARKERLVKKRLSEATKNLLQSEQKVSLQGAVDAYLGSSLKQESTGNE